MENVIPIINAVSPIVESIAWPLIVLLILILYQNTFSNILKILASRVSKLGTKGIDFEALPKQKNINESIQEKESLNEVLDNMNLGLIKEYQDILTPEFETGAKKHNLTVEDFLRAKTTELYLAWHYEKIYRVIFGTQILALQTLNATGLKSTKSAIQAIYDRAVSDNAGFYDGISYENWLSFLETNDLIIINEDNVEISIEGQGFLNYINEQKYSYYKVM